MNSEKEITNVKVESISAILITMIVIISGFFISYEIQRFIIIGGYILQILFLIRIASRNNVFDKAIFGLLSINYFISTTLFMVIQIN